LRRVLSYLLITLIVLQSVVVSASSQENHQVDVEHKSYDHEHQQQGLEQALEISTGQTLLDDSAPGKLSDSTQVDCQHCCQCHGSAQGSVACIRHELSDLTADGLVTKRINHYQTLDISPKFRPPIA